MAFARTLAAIAFTGAAGAGGKSCARIRYVSIPTCNVSL